MLPAAPSPPMSYGPPQGAMQANGLPPPMQLPQQPQPFSYDRISKDSPSSGMPGANAVAGVVEGSNAIPPGGAQHQGMNGAAFPSSAAPGAFHGPGMNGLPPSQGTSHNPGMVGGVSAPAQNSSFGSMGGSGVLSGLTAGSQIPGASDGSFPYRPSGMLSSGVPASQSSGLPGTLPPQRMPSGGLSESQAPAAGDGYCSPGQMPGPPGVTPGMNAGLGPSNQLSQGISGSGYAPAMPSFPQPAMQSGGQPSAQMPLPPSQGMMAPTGSAVSSAGVGAMSSMRGQVLYMNPSATAPMPTMAPSAYAPRGTPPPAGVMPPSGTTAVGRSTSGPMGPSPPAMMGLPSGMMGPSSGMVGPTPPTMGVPSPPSMMGPPSGMTAPSAPGAMGQSVPPMMGPSVPGMMGPSTPGMPGMMGSHASMMPPSNAGMMPQSTPGMMPTPTAMGSSVPGMMGSSVPQMMGPSVPGMMGPSVPGMMGPSGPGMMGPSGPGMMGPSGPGLQQKPRLDANLMPSAVQVIEEDRSTRSGPFPTGFPNAEHPPLSSTEYYAQDQGNCNPKFMRATLYVAPASSDMLKNSQIPFSIAISPFAALDYREIRPPIVDLGELGPVRCHRCKAYMCAFMEFQDGGRRFKCPFCLSSTAVDDPYFAHLDHNGRRTDLSQRPEQFLGSYEFVATKPYCKNGVKPKEPAFIFMLDVSYTAVHCGLVSVFCKNIRRLLNDLPRDANEEKSSLRVGFATYDQTIHFYNLKSPMGQPEMLVIGDMADVFVPLVDGFLVTVDEAESAITSLLVEIEKMFLETRITETVLGPVVQAGLDALKCADRSGKLFVFHTNLPVYDAPGKLKNRDDRKLLGSDKEKTVLQPGSDFYVKLGEECVKSGCAVDLFLFPNSFVDVASLSPMCTITGGSLYKYHYFEAQKDSERFLADLAHDISREIVFDVMMRVRTSTGLRPTGFFGAFYMENSTDMEMGAVDCDKGVHVEIRHDDKLPEGSAQIQTAILFTSCSGQRRLRVHNLALAVSSDYNQLYRVADPDCLVSFLFKQAECLVREKAPKEMREAVTTRCAQMLATYREKCSEQAPLGQLILPECLKLLPLYGNCVIKNDAVSGGSDVTVDDRAWMMQLVPGLRVDEAMLWLYPVVFPVSDLTLDQPSQEISLPSSVRSSYENLSSDKAYIIFNGLMMFIWIGLGVPQEWVQNVFNSSSVSQLNTETHVVPERDNAHSRALRSVIERVNAGRAHSMKLFLIRQQDALEAWMKRFLVEDRTSSMPSYVDYLCNIHREVRSLLS